MPDVRIPEVNWQQGPAYFPPEKQWARLDGVIARRGANEEESVVVSVVRRDQKGAEIIGFWTDLPNAMYLLNLLENIQRQTAAKVPTRPPCNCTVAEFSDPSGA